MTLFKCFYFSKVLIICMTEKIMAFNYPNANETWEGSSSKINEAWLKMQRLHKMQDYLNMAGMNLLATNLDLGIYNYQVKINSCNALLDRKSVV